MPVDLWVCTAIRFYVTFTHRETLIGGCADGSHSYLEACRITTYTGDYGWLRAFASRPSASVLAPDLSAACSQRKALWALATAAVPPERPRPAAKQQQLWRRCGGGWGVLTTNICSSTVLLLPPADADRQREPRRGEWQKSPSCFKTPSVTSWALF